MLHIYASQCHMEKGVVVATLGDAGVKSYTYLTCHIIYMCDLPHEYVMSQNECAIFIYMNTPSRVGIHEYILFIYMKTPNHVDIYEIYHIDRYKLHKYIYIRRSHTVSRIHNIRPKKARNVTGTKGGWFQIFSDKILQLFSPLTSLARWACFVEF